MQSFRTCFASQITGIRVGRSVVTGPVQKIPGQTDVPENRNSNTLKNKIDHDQRLAAIRNDPDLSENQKKSQVDAANADWDGQNVAFTPPAGQMENTITDPVTGATRTKSLGEIKGEQLARDKLTEPAIAEGDENSDGIPDETQDIIHVVLTGGEKRSILRSDLAFAQTVLDRRQADFPPYAQRGPIVPDRNGVTDQNSTNSPNTANATNPANFVEPNGPGTGYYPHADKNDREDTRNHDRDAYPRVGDWLVEDWDVFTDKYIQKVYDNATFGRYFKASLN